MPRYTIAEEILRHGYAITTRLLRPTPVRRLAAALDEDLPESSPGRRDILSLNYIRDLARDDAIQGIAFEALQANVFAVRGVYFSKSPHANWAVAWHQDRTIAVKQSLKVPRYTKWSTKVGIPHCEPPAEILENMVSIRIHLDDTTEDNGALHVIDGSHIAGKIPEGRIPAWVNRPETICEIPTGAVMAMKPLLLHRSRKLVKQATRRVIHLEFACTKLPMPLEWHREV